MPSVIGNSVDLAQVASLESLIWVYTVSFGIKFDTIPVVL